jgi:hypothetical protein
VSFRRPADWDSLLSTEYGSQPNSQFIHSDHGQASPLEYSFFSVSAGCFFTS